MGDWINLLKALRPKGCLFDRVEVTASDNRRERIEVMTITDWIIQLSIFGVLALAVRPAVPYCAGPQSGSLKAKHGERPLSAAVKDRS
jgi:hypothetical protein